MSGKRSLHWCFILTLAVSAETALRSGEVVLRDSARMDKTIAEPKLYKPYDDVHVVYPALGCPAIVVNDRAFQARVRVNAGDSSPSRFRLAYGQSAWTLEIAEAENVSGNEHLVKLRIPDSVPVDCLCDLVVYCGDARLRQPNAVIVLDDLPTSFDVVQITDTEVHEGETETSKRLEKAIEEINLISPAFVIASGDLTWSGRPEQFDELIRIFRMLKVPLFTAIGNADYHGEPACYFARLNPYQEYSFDYGPCRFAGLDAGNNNVLNPDKGFNPATDHRGTGLSKDQVQWLDRDLSSCAEGMTKIVFMHFPAVSQPDNRGSISHNREEFKDVCNRHGVALSICGHTHINAAFDQEDRWLRGECRPVDGPVYVQCTTTSSDTKSLFHEYSYRLIRIRDGKLDGYTYDGNRNGKRDSDTSVPVGRIRLQRYMLTAGNKTNYQIDIRNGLRERLEYARVRFTVPGAKPLKGLKMRGAKLVGTYSRGKEQEVVAQLSVPPLMGVRVTLEVQNDPGE